MLAQDQVTLTNLSAYEKTVAIRPIRDVFYVKQEKRRNGRTLWRSHGWLKSGKDAFLKF